MKLMIVALIMAATIVAQDEKPQTKPGQPGIIKFVELKHLSGDRLNRVTNFVQQLYIGRARLVYDAFLKTFAIQADSPEHVAAVEEMIRRFDVPAAETRTRQIQLTVYVLEPSEEEATSGQRVPAELASTAEQLRTLFGHKHMRVVETTLMQGREDATFGTSGLLAAAPGKPAATYQAKFKNIRYNESQKSVSVNGFGYAVSIPNFGNSGVESDLTIKDGQKLVIGKVTKGQNEPNAFLVVTAKVD